MMGRPAASGSQTLVSEALVVVNADDFGMSSSINQAVVHCFQAGLISSATIMANMPGFEEACDLADRNQLHDRIGVHLNLTEGRPLTQPIRENGRLCDAAGEFRRVRPSLLTSMDRQQIDQELTAQITRCRQSGLPLTHADSHQHVHTEPMVFAAVVGVLKKQGIRRLRLSRNMFGGAVSKKKRLLKSCFNAAIGLAGLRGTQHFGTVDEFDQYRKQNQLAADTFEILTHPAMREDGVILDHLDGLPLLDRLTNAFTGMQLISYGQLQSHLHDSAAQPAANRTAA